MGLKYKWFSYIQASKQLNFLSTVPSSMQLSKPSFAGIGKIGKILTAFINYAIYQLRNITFSFNPHP
jgi:hypothetical protein